MSKKLLSLVLVGLLLNIVGVIPAYASSKEDTRARFAEKVKEGISKLGTGPEARVEVKLRDGRKLKGYISATGENNFVIVDAKSGCFDDSISASQTGNRQQSFKRSQNRDHSWDCGRPAISLNCGHWSYLVSTFFYTCDQHLTKSFS